MFLTAELVLIRDPHVFNIENGAYEQVLLPGEEAAEAPPQASHLSQGGVKRGASVLVLHNCFQNQLSKGEKKKKIYLDAN